MMSVIKTWWSSIYVSYEQVDDECMKLMNMIGCTVSQIANNGSLIHLNKHRNKHVKMMHIEAYTQK